MDLGWMTAYPEVTPVFVLVPIRRCRRECFWIDAKSPRRELRVCEANLAIPADANSAKSSRRSLDSPPQRRRPVAGGPGRSG